MMHLSFAVKCINCDEVMVDINIIHTPDYVETLFMCEKCKSKIGLRMKLD